MSMTYDAIVLQQYGSLTEPITKVAIASLHVRSPRRSKTVRRLLIDLFLDPLVVRNGRRQPSLLYMAAQFK